MLVSKPGTVARACNPSIHEAGWVDFFFRLLYFCARKCLSLRLCATSMPGVCGCQERELYLPELELQVVYKPSPGCWELNTGSL